MTVSVEPGRELPNIGDCTCGACDRLLTVKEVAHVLKVCVETVRRWEQRGLSDFPRAIRMRNNPSATASRKLVHFSYREILEWLAAQKGRRPPRGQPKGYKPIAALEARARKRAERKREEARRYTGNADGRTRYGSRSARMGY